MPRGRRRTSLALPPLPGLPGLPGIAGGDFATIQLLGLLRKQQGSSLEPDLFLERTVANAAGVSAVVSLVMPRRSAFLLKKVYGVKKQGATDAPARAYLHRGFDTLLVTEETLPVNKSTIQWDKLQGVLLSNPQPFGGVEGLRLELDAVVGQVQELRVVVVGTPLVYVQGGTESLDALLGAQTGSYALATG